MKDFVLGTTVFLVIKTSSAQLHNLTTSNDENKTELQLQNDSTLSPTTPKKNELSRDEELETFSLNIWYILLAAVISVTFLFLLNFILSQEMISCQCQCTSGHCPERRRSKKEGTVPCYLCDKRVSKAQWTDGSHRRNCATKRRGLLERMPRPLEVNCPNCIQVLRLWPASMGEGFICDNAECRTPKDEVLVNSGYNRLNCFVCDYDICMACANRVVCQKQNVKPNVSCTGLAARNWMIHMNPMAKQSFESSKSSTTSSKNKKRSAAAMLARLSGSSTGQASIIREGSKRDRRRSSAASYPSRRCYSAKATPYARKHGSGGTINTSAKSLPQPFIKRLTEEEEENNQESMPKPTTSMVASKRRPPFSKAVSLDYDDSRYTYCSTSSKQTTVRLESDLNLNTSEDEDSEALMMSATSEVRTTAADLKANRMRTVSTVSECSEFSTCH